MLPVVLDRTGNMRLVSRFLKTKTEWLAILRAPT
jgi:hypothetical protein